MLLNTDVELAFDIDVNNGRNGATCGASEDGCDGAPCVVSLPHWTSENDICPHAWTKGIFEHFAEVGLYFKILGPLHLNNLKL